MFNSIVEFIVVDFGSTDGTLPWIESNFKEDLTTGYLKLFSVDKLSHWHSGTCKNTAHFVSSGKILTNLDGDNFVGKKGSSYILNAFEKYGDNLLFHQFSGIFRDGSFGRISISRKRFEEVGGYDQSLLPVNYEDLDLILRLVLTGSDYKHFLDKRYCTAISNSKEESMMFANSDLSWDAMRQANEDISMENILNNKLVANGGVYGIRDNILEYDILNQTWKRFKKFDLVN